MLIKGEKNMTEQNLQNCKACKNPISDKKDSYLISNQGERVCKKCGDAIAKNENAKTPGKVKVVDLENGEKALALTKP
jgi:hypothetical protein